MQSRLPELDCQPGDNTDALLTVFFSGQQRR